MTAPIYGVMEHLNGPIVEWRIMCPIHGLVIAEPKDAHLVGEHQTHLSELVTDGPRTGSELDDVIEQVARQRDIDRAYKDGYDTGKMHGKSAETSPSSAPSFERG